VVNVVAVLAGSAVGLAVGSRLPERIRDTALQGVGLVTLVLGVREAQATRNLTFPLGAVVVGGLLGEALRIEDRLESLGGLLRRVATRGRAEAAGLASTFVEGFVTASLIFCVGPLTILGSIQDGLGRGAQDLFVKSALDGTVAVVLASTLGIGVAASALTVLVVQGGITLAAAAANQVLTARMIAEMTATGGILILGIGLRLLDLKRIRVGSFLPALLVAPIAVALLAR
jgi:uncharacterized membrane protein YqgA involved in biofilm formation